MCVTAKRSGRRKAIVKTRKLENREDTKSKSRSLVIYIGKTGLLFCNTSTPVYPPPPMSVGEPKHMPHMSKELKKKTSEVWTSVQLDHIVILIYTSLLAC